jgi:hypothetical protein
MQQKKSKKSSKNYYFTSDVDVAIRRLNECTDQLDRNMIYDREIRPAFEKLVENIIHTFKFYYTDGQTLQQLQHEVVSFLVEKLPKFATNKGKAFSYFSIVAKNYLILNNNKNFKKLVESEQIDATNTTDQLSDNQDVLVLEDFIDAVVNYFDVNLTKCFPKKTDQAIAGAVIELFRKRESIELYNKKALYIYVREMTNANTQQITKVIKTVREKYSRMLSVYDEKGYIPHNTIY